MNAPIPRFSDSRFSRCEPSYDGGTSARQVQGSVATGDAVLRIAMNSCYVKTGSLLRFLVRPERPNHQLVFGTQTDLEEVI
jgi:hypothetical protein